MCDGGMGKCNKRNRNGSRLTLVSTFITKLMHLILYIALFLLCYDSKLVVDVTPVLHGDYILTSVSWGPLAQAYV